MTTAPLGIAHPDLLTPQALRDELAHLTDYDADYIDLLNVEQLREHVTKARIKDRVESAPLLISDPDSYDFMFNGHAGTGASGAERWMSCTASLQSAREFLETLSPNQQYEFANANAAARQGTTAHAAAESELLLMLGQIEQEAHDETIRDLTLNKPKGEEYDTEMAEHLTEYTDYVQNLIDSGREVSVEDRVSAVVEVLPTTAAMIGSDYYELRGTADATALPAAEGEESDVITVVDLKYGNGIDVSVEANPQTRIYGLGVLQRMADLGMDLPHWIEYAIVQPRLGGIKVSREPVDALLSWRDQHLTPALSNALMGTDNGAKFRPSPEACQFCPARGACPALAESRMAEASDLFDDLVEAEAKGETITPHLLTDERLGLLLTQMTALVDLKDDLKSEAQRRLHRGDSVPGFKLVSYTPARKWKPEASENLKNNAKFWRDPTMITPTQAVALYPKKEAPKLLLDMIESPDKRPIIASFDSNRKEWEGVPPEAMFADESESEQ